MKDRYPKALQSLRNRGQNGDYMLQSRTASDLADKEPVTIEYDDNYQNRQKKPSAEEPEFLANTEDFKEELMLIESGNFVLTAPSLATQGIRNVVEQREDPPPPDIGDIGGIGRSRTESFEADFTGIEKTYTTFVNVAEDQIYPLELKYFLEAALEEGVEPLPRKKGSKNISSRRTMVTNHSKATTKSLQNTSTKASKNNKPLPSSTTKIEEKDSDSVSSESKKFRLFPNLRDVATRRTRRIESVRQRLLEGRKRDKKDKYDRTKEEQPTSSNAALIGETEPLQRQEHESSSSPMVSSLKPRVSKPSKIVPAIESARATSPMHTDVTLQELAEKILGKEIPKSEVSVYDFTKSKRKKKKKKENTLNGSTSFPVLSSPDMSWDSPKSLLASQDDDVVKYDTKSSATKNDISDTATVARGFEAVYSGVDDDRGLYMTVEKRKDAPAVARLPSTEKSVLAETGSKLFTPNVFALSRSFDDIYHSSIVQSIRNEIVTSKPPENHAPQDLSTATTSDPALQQEFKWFNFGRQQKQQPTTTYTNLEHSDLTRLEAADDRDDAPSMSDARIVLDVASPTPKNEAVTNTIVEGNPELFEKISSNNNAADCNIDKVINGKRRHRKSSGRDVNDASTDYESFNSVRLENDEDNVSVITERSEKVVSNFVDSFAKLLLLFGRKVNNVVTCAPMEINGTSIIEDLTFHDDIDEESAVVENENELEIVQKKNKLDESVPSPKDMEVIVGETVLDGIPVGETVLEDIPVAETVLEDIPVSKRVVTMTSFPSKNSSISMASRMSSKTYDSDDSETVDSGDDDDENITRTSTGTSEWDEGAKTHWCSCTN
jgi:hypothetical protein